MNDKFPLALPKGTVLAGQYLVEKVLGQGGFGITYMATDHKDGQKVAIKEFFPDSLCTRKQSMAVPMTGKRGESFEYGKKSFLEEARTLAQFIGNENIVRIHTYFEENATAYFVMDYIEGVSLEQYINYRGGRLDWIETARILLPVMDALGAVHDKGIVHRDVTPDNIYITLDGKVKLIDFGAARYSIGDKTRSLDVVLKHGYAPKEQYVRRGRQGPYTDVYALGATFYYALSGRIPPDSISRIDEDDLIPLSTLGAKIPEEVENAISKALEVQPADRFQSMAEFKDALTGSIEDYNLDQVVVPINTIHEIHQTAPEPQKKETINLDEDSFFISAEELRASSERAKEYVEFNSPSDKASAEGDSEPSRFVTESVVHTGSRSDNLTELKVEYDATEDLEAKSAEGKFVTSQIEHDPRKSSTAGAERFTIKPWMIAAAVGVLGLIIGIIIFVATRTNGEDPKSTTTVSERTTAATSATTESAEDTSGSSGSESSGEESASDANDGKDEESSETSEEDPTTTTTKAKGAEMSEDTKKTKESKDSKDTKSTTKGTTKSTSQTTSEDDYSDDDDDTDDTDYSDDDTDDTDDTEQTSGTTETTSDTTTTTTTETTTTTTTEMPIDTSEEPTSDSTLNEDL